MSLNIQQIITDAKELAGRLKERNCFADMLLNDTHGIRKKIDAMKQYKDEVDELNVLAHQKPHTSLVAYIHMENRNLMEIKVENIELRNALEEHQIALEHIMTKYRLHTNQQIYRSTIDFSLLNDQKYNEIIRDQAEKIKEMAAIMEKAASMDDDKTYQDGELISMLKAENKGLREMLDISCKFGSLGKLSAPTTEDKNIQTEQPNPI
ncbi:PREDICTED: FGFR1 oncogene partner 2 homolog [Nicrophorus vespilloides]|uniref:FGFR1 oncogene partner 2 homolog n=1 Tax=Nicrophorus vespilloides TaxID=110193 RepID=A0ABM1MXG2_NICVS|nr:PREDICTED: FGFR1 oncogene partner 2 homolog [Nicrophorus vespilloides]XP_017779262.1 PREDICTED: FGFR1 oncogene partner 2 homolog [Nicrophorus vespilloides]